MLGDNRKYISALIVPSFATLRSQFPGISSKFKEDSSFITDNSVLEFFKNRLEVIQEDLIPYEKVVKFTLLPEPFSIENEVLTSTLKVRRKVIHDKFSTLIDAMYL